MIGVFDSGSGGLTVLTALREALPEQCFIYFGDHGNAPYGNKDEETIYRLTLSSVEQLFRLGCSLVIVACNTAAATGLRRLQQTWLPAHHPEKRVSGVVVPMGEAVTGMPWTADPDLQGSEKKTVAVFATRYTVESGVFVEETAKRAPHVDLVQQACPSLVRLIEENAPVRTLEHAVRRYVQLLLKRLEGKRLDAVLLGCTHYPLIENLFAQAFPYRVEILSQPRVTASSLANYLMRHPEFACRQQPGATFYTSADPDQVTRLARRFFSNDHMQFKAMP